MLCATSRGRWRAISRASQSICREQSRAEHTDHYQKLLRESNKSHITLAEVRSNTSRNGNAKVCIFLDIYPARPLRSGVSSKAGLWILLRIVRADLFSPQWEGSIHPWVWWFEREAMQRCDCTPPYSRFNPHFIWICRRTPLIDRRSNALHVCFSFLKKKSHPRLWLTPF